MNLWNKRRKSARAIIIQDGKVLVFFRKRYSKISGEWIEYYSIPGGGIDKGETAEQAVIRELREEMGVEIQPLQLVARSQSRNFEHEVFTARIVSGEPHLMLDSEEAEHMNEGNQYIATWIDVGSLTKRNLRYYGHYLELIQQLSYGMVPDGVQQINVR